MKANSREKDETNLKLKSVRWIHKKRDGSTFDLGYAEMNRQLYDRLPTYGIVDDESSDVMLHCCSPRMFRPVANKINIVCTMWEGMDFPIEQRPYIDMADAIIVPTTFVKNVFAQHITRPIYVSTLGYDEAFTYKKRVLQPNDPFQWLIVGAPNARKGIDLIEAVWNKLFINRWDCSLYMKMTTNDQTVWQETRNEGFIEHYPGVFWKYNIVLDYRKLPLPALVQTYHNSNGFLYPTAGEGFGLTLLESLVTGLPSVVTKYSGVLDFTSDDTVYYTSYRPVLAETVEVDGSGSAIVNSVEADPYDVVQQMLYIMTNYRAALLRGKRASQSVRHLTWDYAAKTLAMTLQDIAGREAKL